MVNIIFFSYLIRDENKCREKWVNYLDPTLNHDPITVEEDQFLLEIVKYCGPGSWSTIAQYFPGRSDMQLFRRWRAISGK